MKKIIASTAILCALSPLFVLAAITDNIQGSWKFDESSGNGSDATANANNLTNNATVTYSAGKINNGANFVRASSQYFSITNAAQTGLGLNSNYTFAGWVKFATIPSSGQYYEILRKWYSGVNTNPGPSFTFQNPSGTTQLQIGYGEPDVSGNDQVYAHVNWSPSTGVWYFLASTLHPSDNTVGLYINGVSQSITYSNSGTTAHAIGTNTSPFTFGTYYSGGSTGNFLDGSLDDWSVWTRVLSGAEITTLYNSGTGLQYPFTVATVTFPFYWNMDF
jgi:hypothetical protein